MAEDDLPSRRKSDEIPTARPIRILAVDDDPAYVRYLTFVLTRAGFEVLVGLDGASAIQQIREGCKVDVLLIDLAMPGLDGIETVRQVQLESHLPGLYTILLTAHEGVETKLRALEGGLDDFITKKSLESEILAKIRSAARRLELERQLQARNEHLQTLALTDELTGIANRRALFQAGETMLRSGEPLSVTLFDLDRFKQVNDTHGHLVGDRILSDVAAAFKLHTRYGDLIGRYGGDEFVMLLPDTDVDEARVLAERVASKIRQLTWSINGTLVNVSVQFGISCSTGAPSTLPALLAACDQALYRGKRKRSDGPDGLTTLAPSR